MKIARRLLVLCLTVVLFAALLLPMLPTAHAANISVGAFETKVKEFLNDARWKNGLAWDNPQKPKLSTYSSSGCCAYAADFAAYVYGSKKYAWYTSSFTKYTNLNDIRAGDIIHITGHWFVVISRTGNNFYTCEGNFSDKVRVTTTGWGIRNGKIYNLKAKDPVRTFEYGFHYNFSDLSYTCNYNVNGGTGANSSVKVGYKGNIVIPAAPTREGYTFTGWTAYRHGDGTWYCPGYGWHTEASIAANGYSKKLYEPGVTYELNDSWLRGCTDNTAYTFYAQWKPNTYSVTYDANGGDGAPAAQTKTYGVDLTLSSEKPIRTGYVFMGWSTDSNGSETTYQPGGSFVSNANTILYAIWTPANYVIRYDADGGTGVPGSVEAAYGSKVTITQTLPTCPGFKLKGWSVNQDGTGTIYKAGDKITVDGDMTLYAVWERIAATPKIATATNAYNGVKLTWKAAAGAEKYQLFVKTATSGWKSLGYTSGTTLTWKNAKSGVTYTFGIRCTNADGSVYTSAFDSTGKTIQYIARPSIYKIANMANGVAIAWNKVPGAAKYKIVVKTATSGWKTIAYSTGSTYTWTGAESGVTYTFGIVCVTADGKTVTSAFDSTGKTIKYIACPRIAKLQKVSSGIKITWNKVPGAAKYKLIVKEPGGSWKTLWNTINSSYTWTGAVKGKTYIFSLRCMTADGKSYTSGWNSSGWTIKFT